jgi:hypothetical protein
MIRFASSPTVRARAAQLVHADAVRWTGATASGAAVFDVNGYRVTVARAACRVEDCACSCRWAQFGGRSCSHVRAVRLAWHRAAIAYAQRRRAERAAERAA